MTSVQDAIARRLGLLEAETAIRACLSDYMDICDRMDEATDLAPLGALFTRDAVWMGGGGRYGKDFGSHEGREAIIAWLSRFCTTPPHFAMNAHFLGSEAIRVLSDRTATGRWMMLQTPTFANGESYLMAARLQIGFAFEEDRWRMAHFHTTNLYARPVSSWDQNVPIPKPLTAAAPFTVAATYKEPS